MYTLYILYLLIAFLIGSIPFGYILVKLKTGIDIRKEGSGNIGSTNVKRVAGRKTSILVQALDILKGLIPLAVFQLVFKDYSATQLCTVALVSVLGHMFSPFLSFKGGKGINTTLGAFFLICPAPILGSVLIHIILGLKIKTVSIRSIILAFAIPILAYIFKYNYVLIAFTLLNAFIILIMHKDNIRRVISKTEK